MCANFTFAGYEKKKNKLLAPFLKPTPPNPTTPAPSQQARGGAGGEGGGGGGNGEVVVRDLTRDQVVRDLLSEDGGGTTDSTRVSDSSGLNISVAGEPTDTR